MDIKKSDIFKKKGKSIEVLKGIILYIIYKFQDKYKEGINTDLLNLFCYLVDGIRKNFKFELDYTYVSNRYVNKVLWEMVGIGKLCAYYSDEYGCFIFRFWNIENYDPSMFICDGIKDYQLSKINYLIERYSGELFEGIRSKLLRVALKIYLREGMKVADSRDVYMICSAMIRVKKEKKEEKEEGEERKEVKKFVGREYIIHKRSKMLALIYYLILEYQCIKGIEIYSSELYRIMSILLRKVGINDVYFEEFNGDIYSKEISYYIHLLSFMNFIEGICNEKGRIDRYRVKVVKRFPLGVLDIDEMGYIKEVIEDSNIGG